MLIGGNIFVVCPSPPKIQENAKMRKCKNAKMRKCENAKMRKCENYRNYKIKYKIKII
jgi:hypothetical protein